MRLYEDLAIFYDLENSKKDYESESKTIKDIITKYKQSKGNRLLDVGCGTGNSILYLTDDFDCYGIDLNQEMIDIARGKNIDAEFYVSDMNKFKSNKKFDVIICLYSTICYAGIENDKPLSEHDSKVRLNDLVKRFSNNLEIGGVLIIEPWSPENQTNKDLLSTSYDDMECEGYKMVRLRLSKVIDDRILEIKNHYVITDPKGKKEEFSEKDYLNIFAKDDIMDAMRTAGLEADAKKVNEMGLYIGVKKLLTKVKGFDTMGLRK